MLVLLVLSPARSFNASVSAPRAGDGGEGLRRDVNSFLSDAAAAGDFVSSCDSWMTGFSPDFSRKLAERGWIGMTWPERFGGHGRSELERLVVIEELLAAGAPLAAHWFADRQVGPALLRYGSEGLRQELLPGMARAEIFVAIGLSEPDSGSDLASVRTRATRSDDGWTLEGRKIWTSHAHECQYMVTLCRTDRTGDRHAGLTQFIVDLSAPGVVISPIVTLNGEHHFNEVVLDNVHVGDDHVLGDVGSGWQQVSSELAWERSGPERYLTTMPMLQAFAREASASGSAPMTSSLADLFAQMWSIRLLSTGVAEALQAGSAPQAEAALVKDLGTSFERHSVETVRRFVSPSWNPQLYELACQAQLGSPGYTVRGGTTEILRSVVAKNVAP